MLCNFLKKATLLLIWSQVFFLTENRLFSDTILVTDPNGNTDPGTLGYALLSAVDGDVIDCAPIAGQIIGVGNQFPAMGLSLVAPSSSVTILGRGVVLDAGGTPNSVLCLAQGSATISDFIIQNGVSKGGDGGAGIVGGGGGTGGGGGIYIHTDTTMTISSTTLRNNQAVGGNGGIGNSTGGSGGGGGGYGGGRGGAATRIGSAGGGGGHKGGTNGGTTGGVSDGGGVGSPNTQPNCGGAGGGGAKAAASHSAGNGGGTASNYQMPSHIGGAGGTCTAQAGGGGGGGAGSGSSGGGGSSAGSGPSAGGTGGSGGHGFDLNQTYGVGGAGGGGGTGGTGYGASGGGGGHTGNGGAGGSLGGGGGASGAAGGAGGFGAGGGGGVTGGVDTYGLGGSGGSGSGQPAGGGGGSGLGGAIFIQGGGLLIVQDGTSFSDNSTIAGTGGTAAAGGSSGTEGSSLGEDIFIRAGGGVTFQIDGSFTVPNPIGGGGLLSEVTGPAVTMSGLGSVSLSGVNTYLGDTLIQSGTLNLNGSITGDLTTNLGGNLSGNAIVGGSIYNRGAISPGNSIGTVSTTDLYLYPTSVYHVEVNSAGDSDQIIASGIAQVSGALVITPDESNFSAPLTYPIINASGGISGIFSSWTSTSPSLISLIYTPLTIEVTYLPLEAIGITGNALNSASCYLSAPITPGSDVTVVNSMLLDLSFGDITNAFEQMSPAQFSTLTEVQLLGSVLVRSTYSKHLQEYCGHQEGRCGNLMSVWVDGIGQLQNQEVSENHFGYRDTTVGGTVGFDYSISNWLLGLAFSSTYDMVHVKNLKSKAMINSYYAGLYSQGIYGKFYLNAAVLGAFNRYRCMRHLSFGEIDRKAYSKHHGNEWLAHFGLGYLLCKSHFQWTPYINLDYVFQHEQSYTESGAQSLNLHVNAKNAMLFQGEVGISVNASYDVGDGELIPMITLAYINQTPITSASYEASFINSSCLFKGTSGRYERNLFAPQIALTYQSFCERVNVSLYYDAKIGNRYWAGDVGFDLTFRF